MFKAVDQRSSLLGLMMARNKQDYLSQPSPYPLTSSKPLNNDIV